MTPEERRIFDLERRVANVQRPQSDAEMNAIAAAMTRADAVARLYGTTASRPVPGESGLAYRKRLAANFAQHTRFAGSRFDSLDAAAFGAIEEVVYQDATHAAWSNDRAQPGQLIPVQTVDAAGRTFTKFIGDPAVWMAPFMTNGQVGHFVRPAGR